MGSSASSHSTNLSAHVGTTGASNPMDPGTFIATDLPRHIVESRLPGSGRMLKGFRIRSNEGVLLICKATVLKFESEAASTAASAGDKINLKKPHLTQKQSLQGEITSQAQELARILVAVGNPETHPHILPYQRWIVSENARRDNRSGLTYQPIYLLRQHCFTTLADRLATRPFLTNIEKMWIIYQILTALDSIHQVGVCHGYLTTENICLTSWNWVVLTDFASFKPTMIPDDDLSDFIYFFQEQDDGGGQSTKRCSLAPERFYTRHGSSEKLNLEEYEQTRKPLTPEMDIFSAGCVLVETMLNGERMFELGDIMEYRRQGHCDVLSQKLNKIESSSIRAACKHMLSSEPSQRLPVSTYLSRLCRVSKVSSTNSPNTQNKLKGKQPSIPRSFADFLWPTFYRLRQDVFSPDARIALAAATFKDAMSNLVKADDEDCKAEDYYFDLILGKTALTFLKRSKGTFPPILDDGNIPNEKTHNDEDYKTTTKEEFYTDLLSETESLLARIQTLDLSLGAANSEPATFSHDSSLPDIFSLQSPMSPMEDNEYKMRVIKNKDVISSGEESVIYLQLILSSIRHVQRPSSKLVAIQMLLKLAKYSTDETRLERIIPTLVTVLDDSNAVVRATTIRVLSLVLEMVQVFKPSDAMLCPQFIFKKVSHLVHDDHMIVRVAFAESIAALAETAQRFSEINHATRLYEAVTAGSSVSSDHHPSSPTSAFSDDLANLLKSSTEEKGTSEEDIKTSKRGGVLLDGEIQQRSLRILAPNTYDKDLSTLQETVASWIVQIATDSSDYSSPPKIALLSSMGRLGCVFGHDGVTTQVLPQMLAFLNDRTDWEVRAALCENLPAACAVVGRTATEHFVIPCIETALVDGNENVIFRALICLSTLVKMGLLTRASIFGSSLGKELSSENKGMTGLLLKYCPLLVHPSSEIRKGALAFVASISSSIVYPDSKMLVLRFISPFLKYEPLHEDLCSGTLLEECICSPLSRISFDSELERLLVEKSAKKTVEEEELWTPIDKESGHATVLDPAAADLEFSSNKEHGADTKKDKKSLSSFQTDKSKAQFSQSNTEESGHAAGIDEEKRCLKAMEKYLALACKHRQNVAKRNRLQLSKDEIAMSISNMSAAYTFLIPSQKFAELTTNGLPEWYEELKTLSKVASNLNSPSSCFRSLSSLSQTYGLGMTYPSNLSQTTRKWKGDAPFTSLDDVLDISMVLEMQEGVGKTDKQRDLLLSEDSSLMSGSLRGEWGATAKCDPSLLDVNLVVDKVNSLELPILPPRLGILRELDGRPFTYHGAMPSKDRLIDAPARNEWKPKTDALISSSSNKKEHTAAVTRLAVAQDQTFFVSASHDGTSKVWELRQLNDATDLSSSLTYSGHLSDCDAGKRICINDVCLIENSHSVATAASDGMVHIWRVDIESSKPTTPTESTSSGNSYYDSARVSGKALVRKVDATSEGQVLSLSHFNTLSSSVVTYATEKGGIHGWDLRSGKEPFFMNIRPEFGYLSSCSVGADRNWILSGTSRGYLILFDVRYQIPVKAWQHSSESHIYRIDNFFTTLPQDKDGRTAFGTEPRPYAYMSCGRNESCVFDLSAGVCRHSFRVLDPEFAYTDSNEIAQVMVSPPLFNEIAVPRSSEIPLKGWSNSYSVRPSQENSTKPKILSLFGGVGFNGCHYMITGGSDRCIRYWDFSSPSKCYTSSGLAKGQPRPFYERRGSEKGAQVFLCRQQPVPVESNRISWNLQRGASKAENCHKDAILDLRVIDHPQQCLLSSSQDGEIKVWR